MHIRKWSLHIVAALLAAISLIAFSPATALASPAHGRPGKQLGRYTVLGQKVPGLRGAHPMHPTDGARALDLSIALPLRNADALNALIAAQNTVGSPLYHQYLTPAQFAASYSPDQATVNAVVAFLKSSGLQVGAISPNHLLIDASGSVAKVEAAFDTQISDFSYHGRTVYAPTVEPSVPAALAGMIQNVGGLDNVGIYHHSGDAIATTPLAGSGPGGGYTPSELRTAYDANSLISSDNGAGQTVAIFELDSYKASDINAYLSNYGLGSAKYSNVVVDGASTTAGAGAIEVELDMEVVSAIAPGATQHIYIGPNSTQGVNDTYNKVVTDDTAKVMSTSWGLCEAQSGNSELASLDSIFAQGAAQGQAFFSAAGDSGAYDCNDTSLAVDSPADDPHVVGVGGTTLNTGSGGSYSSESIWANASDTSRSPEGAGGGGGLSTYFSQPSYQSGPGVSNSYSNGMREVPDVSADADPNTGYSVYCTVSAAGCSSTSAWIAVGGTSAAAPLWTALVADANEYLAGQSKPTFGAASAELYTLFNTSQTYAAYHDITSGNNLHYPATSGYDLASGIGSPDAWNLARDAAGGTVSNPPTISSFSPTSGPVGTSVTITGTNFTGATAVKFNGTSASYTVGSATSITATVPTGATTGAISVTTSAGTATSASSFTVTTSGGSAPTISSFSPTSGAVGASVTITGTNFTGATAVKFNGTSATFTVASSSSITTCVPSGATTGAISVTTANGTATSASSFTVTTSGGTTTQLLSNPGFENGQSPWVESSAGGYQIIDPTNPHTGSYSAWLCGYNNCTDQIWQTVTLPSTTTKVVLSYWLYSDTNEASGSPCYDYFYVRIRNSSGSTIKTVQTKCNSNSTNGWVQYSFDLTTALSAYSGKQVQVYFEGTNDVSLPSDFFVDDVALNDTH
jgi:kumamolisin